MVDDARTENVTTETVDTGREIEASELVGPGKLPLRIQPAAAILPGRWGSGRLLAVWFVRKAFYWLFFGGYALGTWMADVNHVDAWVDIDWASPSSVRRPCSRRGRPSSLP